MIPWIIRTPVVPWIIVLHEVTIRGEFILRNGLVLGYIYTCTGTYQRPTCPWGRWSLWSGRRHGRYPGNSYLWTRQITAHESNVKYGITKLAVKKETCTVIMQLLSQAWEWGMGKQEWVERGMECGPHWPLASISCMHSLRMVGIFMPSNFTRVVRSTPYTVCMCVCVWHSIFDEV